MENEKEGRGKEVKRTCRKRKGGKGNVVEKERVLQRVKKA